MSMNLTNDISPRETVVGPRVNCSCVARFYSWSAHGEYLVPAWDANSSKLS